VKAVWLHGAGLSAGIWPSERIGDGLALDLPGHGDRPRAKEPTVEAFAEAILPDCPERFDLVGHSLGGMVGIVLAATQPDRVGRLVLVDAVIGSSSETLRWQGSIIAGLMMRVVGPRGLGWLFSRGTEGDTRRTLRRGLSAMSRDGLRDALTAATTFDTERWLPRIGMPTLVLAAERNSISRSQGRRIADGIPGATFEEVPGGHMLHTDCPDALYPRISAFLGGRP
jgi:pimeloyl-ACP methyl ester carboxylesterase